MSTPRRDQIAAIAALDDAQRGALYDYVSRQPDAVTRDEAAAAIGLPRSTTAFHLDRLVERGLLDAEYRRLNGRTGPGAGRPSKLYRRAAGDVSASVPPRHYELPGDLLATAIERSEQTGATVRDTLERVAADEGRRLGAAAATLEAALEQAGYQPRDDGAAGIALANCPFHRLATAHTELICQTNAALLRGVAEATDADPACVERVAPEGGSCCVHIARG